MNEIFAGLHQMQPHGVPQAISERLRAKFPTMHVMTTHDRLFRVDAWASAGDGKRIPVAEAINSDPVSGYPDNYYVNRSVGWERVEWQGTTFDILTVTLPAGFDGDRRWHWIVAPDSKRADAFYLAVADWNRQVHGEVLVFEAGCFSKSKELQENIASFSLDDLVLAGELGTTLRADLRRFLDSKEHYKRAKAPWKRGLLLLGPPGNGKTHAVKALLRESGLPCIYVKSFGGKRTDPHDTIPQVFERAREISPCILVLEDLDALIDDDNRALLLNELDGFARNEGIITVATTNHPERLDPSLLHRPSRFDRKFQFALPEAGERQRYLERWAAGLDASMRPTSESITQATEKTKGFTFAYLKEATLSALVDFVSDDQKSSMDVVLSRVIDGLAKEIAALPPGGEAPAPKQKKYFSPFDY